MLIAPVPANPCKLRWSDMPPRRGWKPSGWLAGYHHAAPTALDARASRGERVGGWVGWNTWFMGRIIPPGAPAGETTLFAFAFGNERQTAMPSRTRAAPWRP